MKKGELKEQKIRVNTKRRQQKEVRAAFASYVPVTLNTFKDFLTTST